MPVTTIIGSGFSGLSAAAYLSAAGHEVHVFEKNPEPGGRARQLKTSQGYVFDMGPSWYWMPDVFEKFFLDFGEKPSAYYELHRLDPAFEIVFGKNDCLQVPGNFKSLVALFENIEKGAGQKLIQFMKEGEMKYRISMEKFIHLPSVSVKEYMSLRLLIQASRLNLFTSFRRHVRKYFKHPQLLALMEFPVLFLGGSAQNTPALYSLMNYAGLQLGTWYPMGGFGKVVEGMKKVAEKQGATFHFNSPVEKINTKDEYASSIQVGGRQWKTDGIIASADYHHVESQLMSHEHKNYKNGYWDHKTMAPSCLLFYIGVSKPIPRLQHHTLFFDENQDEHVNTIYNQPSWPSKPLFYVCCPSRTDKTIAPQGHENIFLLMPIAAGLKDEESIRSHYFDLLMGRLESFAGEPIRPFIDFCESYSIRDFIHDYNAYKGNAYGLANTLKQTALLRPRIKNYKLKNLFYAGQLTVPGPGVPPAIISGKIAAGLLHHNLIKS